MVSRNSTLTQARLKELLRYIPDTGDFVWIKRTSNRIHIGDIAGGISSADGYVHIGIDGIVYRAHRLAYLYMMDEFPICTDHINGIRHDNRWSNLRHVDHSENCKNTALKSNNRTGIHGVTATRIKNRGNRIYYVSHITNKLKRRTLYTGRDFFEACCRRKSAENKLNFHKNHGRPQ